MPGGKEPLKCLVGGPYKHDVFVSYSHGTIEEDYDVELQEWSAEFANLLEREVKNNLRRELHLRKLVKFYRDLDHRPGQGVDPLAPLPDQLQEEVGLSAILVVLMSPDYINSQWCARERDWWCQKQVEFGYPHRERTAVARIWHTGDMAWPEWLKPHNTELPGTDFCDRKIDRPMGWPLPKLDENSFLLRKKIVGMAGSILSKLRALRTYLEMLDQQQDANNRRNASSELSLYLHGRIENEQQWGRARAELRDQGYKIAPDGPEKIASGSRKVQLQSAKRIADMKACDAVLLLGTENDKELSEDITTIGGHDRLATVDITNKLLPCAIIDMAKGKSETPANRLKTQALAIKWIGTEPSPWVPRMKEWLAASAQ